jgi:hypothetical protein
VQEILGLADVDLQRTLTEFGPCIQHWCPILLNEQLRGGASDLSQQPNESNRTTDSLIWLCLWLVARRACLNPRHIDRCELYRTLKQILALLQTRPELQFATIQVSMLIAVYEFGGGLQVQAHQTLGNSITMLRLFELNSRRLNHAGHLHLINWMKVSMLMLDRYVTCPLYVSKSSSSLQLDPDLDDQ